MAKEQNGQALNPGKRAPGDRRFYVVTAFSAVVVLVQLVLLAFPGERPRPAKSETVPTRPPPTQAFRSAPTIEVAKVPTSTPSPTRTTVPPTATLTPTEVPPTPVPSSTPTETPVPCDAPLAARYVSDVTIPDYTTVEPGQQFDKTWRLSNSGECPWPPGVKPAYVSGARLSGGSSETLAGETAPGEEVEVTVSMTAPSSPGTHTGRWRMQTAEGEFFGAEVFVTIKIAGAQPKPSATPVPAPVEVLSKVNVDNGEWGMGSIEVEHEAAAYYFSGSDGRSYRGQMGFLSRPESLARVQDFWSWRKLGDCNWRMRLVVRQNVSWAACPSSDKICFESDPLSPTQCLLTAKVFYRPEVWVSLMESEQAGGWQAVAQNPYYHDIQRSVFYPIIKLVPEVPCIGFKFTPVD